MHRFIKTSMRVNTTPIRTVSTMELHFHGKVQNKQVNQLGLNFIYIKIK